MRVRWTGLAWIGDAEKVEYTAAVAAICSDLEDDASGEAVRAGLRLALLAWRELGDTDVAWDRFGLNVLAVEELLRDLPDVAVVCDPPSKDDTEAPAAVARLVRALAAHLDRGAADDRGALVDRLTRDAAAGQLRRAVAALP